MVVAALLGLLALLLLLAIGVPIFAALMGVSAALLLSEGKSVAGLGQHVLDHLNSLTLMAVPFFVLAAVLMKGGGIARALFDWATVLVGRMPGGLPIAAILATAVFAAINGSSVATALAMGTMVVPLLTERGYDRRFVLGLVAAAGTLGILIPPSLPLVVYGLVSETSVPRLFLAGVVPGLMQVLFFAAIVLVKERRAVAGGAVRSMAEALPWGRTTVRAMPAVSVPVIVLGGIYTGLVTVTEAAALAAVAALAVNQLIYRSVSLPQLPPMVVEAMESTAKVIMIVASALLLSHWIGLSGLARELTRIVTDAGLEDWQFLLLMCAILLVMGTLLEGYSIILITVPLTLPILDALAIDTVHYGIILILTIEMAMLTPPIGLNLFVMAGVARAPIAEVARGVAPFFAAMVVLLLLVAFVPALSTALPNLVFGVR